MKKIKLLFFSSPDFTDNALHLYTYLKKKNDPRFEYIWLVYNPKNFENDENTTFISRAGDLSILNDVDFSLCSHHTTKETYQRFNKDHIVINLSHGIGIKGKKVIEKMQSDPFYPSSLFDYIVSLGGSAANEAVFKFNNMPDESKILPVGYPRNDILFNEPQRQKRGITKILYMPTFKQSLNKTYSEEYFKNETGIPLFETKEDLEKINSWLDDHEITIFFKLHRLQKDLEIYNWIDKNIKHIHIMKNSMFEGCFYNYLKDFDALLTDYSSIAIDFLFLDRPEGFIFSDLEDFEKSRGSFCLDPINNSAGHHIYSIDNFKKFCLDVKTENDVFKNRRKEVLQKFVKDIDGRSAERIYKFLCKKVNERF